MQQVDELLQQVYELLQQVYYLICGIKSVTTFLAVALFYIQQLSELAELSPSLYEENLTDNQLRILWGTSW